MALAALQIVDRFERLMAVAAGGETDRHLAHLCIGPRLGLGCLPLNLGLKPSAFAQLIERCFPGGEVHLALEAHEAPLLETRSAMRDELSILRDDERQELVALLEDFRVPSVPRELSLIIATGCLGGDHLWRDLGFPHRGTLSELMERAYPDLKALNNRDMKWKRFFYKQLCERGGGYVCRAPSCDQCTAYHDCFGPEE
ncbi:Nitrogenase FeMo-cofactor synthesis molybdenum delivery protein NifQ [Marinobacterium lacunae]|uniref:Nitrogenase FeMo-cofactor synthesis molybdenum delivery protein NifQ n=1 Tax=Marinobacterium lacunae TaxID=1232683 RepID=A0A081FVL2_9GAMM|nr:nitrogen fixation protein NifQ [Marinobacterium lacunae]KEA62567.1 Nitrogenase FeMo-cofactor synthesis molybdenum delivery protein NifQ [Marinobacterium lacunae]